MPPESTTQAHGTGPKPLTQLIPVFETTGPFNGQAAATWERLVGSGNDAHHAPAAAEPLAQAAHVLGQHGWVQRVAMRRMAQFEKRGGMRPWLAAALILVFNVLGVLVVLAYNSSRRPATLHLQIEADGALLALSGRERAHVEDETHLCQIALSVPDGLRLPAMLGLLAVSALMWAALL